MFDLNVKRSGTNAHLVLAHGAGAGLRHEFMQRMQDLLCEQGINTWTFNFGYMQKAYAHDTKIPPTRLPQLIDEYSHVIAEIRHREPDAQLWVGGKSMGGRVACHLAAQTKWVKGVAVLGYPFHPVGKPDKTRLEILDAITQPILIVQGERDTFGNVTEIGSYCLPVHIQLKYLTDGDHSFKPRKTSGCSQLEHMRAAAIAIAQFIKDGQSDNA